MKQKNADAAASRKLGHNASYMRARTAESRARTEEVRLRVARQRGAIERLAVELAGRQCVAAKVKLLRLTQKLAERFPDLPREVLLAIEELHREAFEELSRGE